MENVDLNIAIIDSVIKLMILWDILYIWYEKISCTTKYFKFMLKEYKLIYWLF